MIRLFLCLGLVVLATGCSSSAGSVAGPESADGGPDASITTEDLVVDEGTFTVGPNQEVVYCVRIPMPAAFQGRDLALVGWDSTIAAPMHHYFMFYDPKSTSGTTPTPCQGDDPEVPAASAGLNLFSTGTLIFVAGTGNDSYRNSAGYGAVLTSNGTFVTNHHVINATASPITVGGKFTLKVAGAKDIPHPTQALSCQTIDISLPAQAATDVTATCLAPYDLDVVSMSSHAHQDLKTFETRMYDGTKTLPEVLYTSTDWESPVVKDLATPLHLKAGQGYVHLPFRERDRVGHRLRSDRDLGDVRGHDRLRLPRDGDREGASDDRRHGDLECDAGDGDQDRGHPAFLREPLTASWRRTRRPPAAAPGGPTPPAAPARHARGWRLPRGAGP